MKVKSKIVARYGDKGRLKAVATVCLDGKFLVTGVRVADCRKGLAVFMPSREIYAGEYRDICFPITSELYKQIKDSVLEAYARPEDDDPAYGDNPEMVEKAERMGGFLSVATGQCRHGMAPEDSEQTGGAPQADVAMVPGTGVLVEDGRQTENPRHTAQSAQHSQ